MNNKYFQVLTFPDNSTLGMWIDSAWFEPCLLTGQAFLDYNTGKSLPFEEQHIYAMLKVDGRKYIHEATYEEPEVERFAKILNALGGTSDIITDIREHAVHLRLVKGKDSFFGNIKKSVPWLIQQKIRENL